MLFNARTNATIPAGAPMLSDPVALPVPPLAPLRVSLTCRTGRTRRPSTTTARRRLGSVDISRRPRLTPSQDARPTSARVVLSAVGIEVGRRVETIVAIGDSITDGGASTTCADRRWPDILAERLVRAGGRDRLVVNLGSAATPSCPNAQIPIC